MRRLFILILLVLVALPAAAQIDIPRISQGASVTQKIGTTDITIDYHRPGVKGREIWGGLVPFDQPWRMGANEATTISFSDPVTIAGTVIPAGKYSFFAIPGSDKWTLVINSDPEQWGAYGYDQSKDVLRVEVEPQPSPHTEWMRFTIDPVTPASGMITLEWEELAVPLPVSVDVQKLVWADVDRTLSSAYASAASFALDSGQRLKEGLEWVNRSIAAGENVFNLWTKARLLQKLGRSKEAIPVMEKSLSLARGNVPEDFWAILQSSMASIRADAAKRK